MKGGKGTRGEREEGEWEGGGKLGSRGGQGEGVVKKRVRRCVVALHHESCVINYLLEETSTDVGEDALGEVVNEQGEALCQHLLLLGLLQSLQRRGQI